MIFVSEGSKLIDGGSINTPPSFVNVHINDIDKHILLLIGKDFREIEHTYGRNEELVFVQKRKYDSEHRNLSQTSSKRKRSSNRDISKESKDKERLSKEKSIKRPSYLHPEQ